MGDYRDTRKKKWGGEGEEGGGEASKPIYVEVKAESRGTPYILITQNVWREIGVGEGIYRIELTNSNRYEYYVYYPGKGKVKLARKELKKGERYRLTATKLNTQDIINELSCRMMQKFGIQLKLDENGNLYMLLPSRKVVKIDKYELEKPFGGEMRLLIKLQRNPYSKATLQLLLSNYDLQIKFISSIQKKKGKVTRPVHKIYELGDFLAITYWKAPKKVTSYIPIYEKLDPDMVLRNRDIIIDVNILKTGKSQTYPSEYRITLDNFVSEYIKSLYQVAANDRESKYNRVKEVVGLIIAENFLKKLGYRNFVRHPFSRYYRKGPDLKADYANESVVFEVKLSRGTMIDLKYDNAIEEINEHVYIKYLKQVKKHRVKKFGVIIIGLPLSMDIPINAIIYYNTWRVEE